MPPPVPAGHPDLDDQGRSQLLSKVRSLRAAGDALLAELGVKAKEAHVKLLDVLASVDGVSTRLSHGKAP